MRLRTALVTATLFATLVAQDDTPTFKTQYSRWSNHDIPAPIAPFLPTVPVNGVAKQDGIMVTVTWESGRVPEAVEVAVIYRTTEGKRMKQTRTTTLVTTGCTPEPCAWMPILFDIGVIDLDSVTITATEWSTTWPASPELVTNKEKRTK